MNVKFVIETTFLSTLILSTTFTSAPSGNSLYVHVTLLQLNATSTRLPSADAVPAVASRIASGTRTASKHATRRPREPFRVPTPSERNCLCRVTVPPPFVRPRYGSVPRHGASVGKPTSTAPALQRAFAGRGQRSPT